MKYRHLPKSFSRGFQDMNAYVRKGRPSKWEQDFIREQTGIGYEEDKQAYKRLQDYDKKYGTETAEFFLEFHTEWYLNEPQTQAGKDIRKGRRTDTFNNVPRTDLMSNTDLGDPNCDSYDVEMTHNPDYKLSDVDKTDTPVKTTRTYKGKYGPADYQYIADPYARKWTDAIIEFIDRSRGFREEDEIDVGIVKLKRNTERWGINATYKSVYVVSVFYPTMEIVREHFQDIDLAIEFLSEEKSRYLSYVHSPED